MTEEIKTIRYKSDQAFAVGFVWGFCHRRPNYGNGLVARQNNTMNGIYGDKCYVELAYNKTANLRCE